MTRIWIGSLALLCGCGLTGNGVPAEETRKLEGFDRIAVSNGLRATVEVVPGSEPAVVVRTDGNLLRKVETRVSGDTLRLGLSGFAFFGIDSDVGLHVQVRVPSLRGASTSGGSSLEARGVTGAFAELASSGGSTVRISGDASKVDVEASGGSRLDLGELRVRDATLGVSGGARVELCVEGAVKGGASGGSQVTVACGPDDMEVDTSGGARVASR